MNYAPAANALAAVCWMARIREWLPPHAKPPMQKGEGEARFTTSRVNEAFFRASVAFDLDMRGREAVKRADDPGRRVHDADVA